MVEYYGYAFMVLHIFICYYRYAYIDMLIK